MSLVFSLSLHITSSCNSHHSHIFNEDTNGTGNSITLPPVFMCQLLTTEL